MARRAVLVAGARTPFVKSFGDLFKVDSIGLGVAAVEGLLKKTKLDPNKVDNIIWGNVVLQTSAPNIAREIVIDLNLPPHIVAHSTSMACSSGLKAITEATTLIESGHSDIIIAGGSDSLSSAEFPLKREAGLGLATAFGPGAKKKQSIMQKIQRCSKIAGGMPWSAPMKWAPQMPAVAERSTGKTMGYHADMMAELNGVPREEQEQFALQSHRRASAARKNGYLDEEIVPCTGEDEKRQQNVVTKDNLIQDDTSEMEKKMPGMKPAFRKVEGGSVTAASSSALTDGGSCVLVMSEQKAKELGYPIDCHLSSWQFSAIDPYPQLLMAPALAIPPCLKKAKLQVKDIDFWEFHEAFSAQVLSTLRALNNEDFCQKWMGHGKLEEIPLDKININGSSIAIGHPFAATGGRLVMAAMNELRRNNKKHSLLSICAAGGLGSVAIVSRDASKA